jgi:hypothetical protein
MDMNEHEENDEKPRMTRESVIRNSLDCYIVIPVHIDALNSFNDLTRQSQHVEAIRG